MSCIAKSMLSNAGNLGTSGEYNTPYLAWKVIIPCFAVTNLLTIFKLPVC